MLAELARESESGMRSVVDALERRLVRREDGAIIVERALLGRYHPALVTRLLRRLFGEYDLVLDRAGTRLAIQFITDAPSGREMQLPGGVRIRSEFGSARIERDVSIAADMTLRIEWSDLDNGFSGTLQIGGQTYRVRATLGTGADAEADDGAAWSARIPVSPHGFPLLIRGRRAGDRIRTSGGTKSLKKLMIERRVPLGRRDKAPVVADADGVVLWVAGIGAGAGEVASEQVWLDLSIRHG
jgi:tRNA(Ile)-lysidine synthase